MASFSSWQVPNLPPGSVPTAGVVFPAARASIPAPSKSRLDLGFFLDRELTHPRIQRVERISRTKIAHHVHIVSAADVDAELAGWLRESYEIARR